MPALVEPVKGFTLVAGLGSGELLLTVHPTVSIKDVKTFIALAKASPGTFSRESLELT